MSNDDLLLVGYVRKAHGLKGEVVVRLTTNRDERVAPGATMVAGDTELVVRSARPKDSDYLVFFEGVTTREAADDLRGSELFAEPLDDPDELWVHELIGSRVIDQDDVDRGEITAVQSNPASDLLVVDDEGLIPVAFVVEIDAEGSAVRIDAPDGLFNL